MPACETTHADGHCCSGWAYGTATQCVACLAARRPPASEMTFTSIAETFGAALDEIAAKRARFEQTYPHVRLLYVRDDREYQYARGRRERPGERHYFVQYALKPR